MKRIVRYYAPLLALLPGLSACDPPNDPQTIASKAATNFSNNANAGYQAASDGYHAASNATATVASAAGTVASENGSEFLDHAYYFEQSTKEGIYDSTDHVAGWMHKDKPKPPHPIADSYCYHVLQDILCYRSPMPGAEHRLVAYQGSHANQPPLAIMQLLPEHSQDPSRLPANRVANAKPVFPDAPTAEAATTKAQPDSSVVPNPDDASQQQLPNPAMTPQL